LLLEAVVAKYSFFAITFEHPVTVAEWERPPGLSLALAG
jgi:hypothetical protein